MQSSSSHLTCPHPNCPSTFKSQHGRTYHIRAKHLNTHGRTANFERQNEQENWFHRIDDAVDGAQTSDIEGSAIAPNNEINDPGRAVPQRIEHPHLNGMFANV